MNAGIEQRESEKKKCNTMPKIRPGMRKPPKGFDIVAPKLDEYEEEMKTAVLAPHAGKRKVESTWEIARINWERTRYVFTAHRRGLVDKTVFEYCVENQFIDGSLAAKWLLKGYERLCCVQCVHRGNHNFGGSCVCRVPAKDRAAGVACSSCGCTGCASGDSGRSPWAPREPAAVPDAVDEEDVAKPNLCSHGDGTDALAKQAESGAGSAATAPLASACCDPTK